MQHNVANEYPIIPLHIKLDEMKAYKSLCR